MTKVVLDFIGNNYGLVISALGLFLLLIELFKLNEIIENNLNIFDPSYVAYWRFQSIKSALDWVAKVFGLYILLDFIFNNEESQLMLDFLFKYFGWIADFIMSLLILIFIPSFIHRIILEKFGFGILKAFSIVLVFLGFFIELYKSF